MKNINQNIAESLHKEGLIEYTCLNYRLKTLHEPNSRFVMSLNFEGKIKLHDRFSISIFVNSESLLMHTLFFHGENTKYGSILYTSISLYETLKFYCWLTLNAGECKEECFFEFDKLLRKKDIFNAYQAAKIALRLGFLDEIEKDVFSSCLLYSLHKRKDCLIELHKRMIDYCYGTKEKCFLMKDIFSNLHNTLFERAQLVKSFLDKEGCYQNISNLLETGLFLSDENNYSKYAIDPFHKVTETTKTTIPLKSCHTKEEMEFYFPIKDFYFALLFQSYNQSSEDLENDILICKQFSNVCKNI